MQNRFKLSLQLLLLSFFAFCFFAWCGVGQRVEASPLFGCGWLVPFLFDSFYFTPQVVVLLFQVVVFGRSFGLLLFLKQFLKSNLALQYRLFILAVFGGQGQSILFLAVFIMANSNSFFYKQFLHFKTAFVFNFIAVCVLFVTAM